MRIWLDWLHAMDWQLLEAGATLVFLCIVFARIGRTLRFELERGRQD